jgi:hypothetical protein
MHPNGFGAAWRGAVDDCVAFGGGEKHDPESKNLCLISFRIFLMFEKTIDGAWSLLHAQLATVAPRPDSRSGGTLELRFLVDEHSPAAAARSR